MSDLFQIFKAYDIRGEVGSQLNKDTVFDIARAFSDWLPTKGTVVVGRDMRPESEGLAEAFIRGLQEQGRTVWDVGLVTSEMSYFAVGKFKLAGSAMITASHNPGKDNGIKLYRNHVIAVGLDAGLDKIRDAFLAGKFKPAAIKPGAIIKKDISESWVKHCLGFINPSKLKSFKVAIDAGNGMAGAILPKVQSHLPIKVTEMFYDLDGTFPNHLPNLHDLNNLNDLVEMVKKQKLDLGVIFDGDGDRALFVDDKGRPITGSDIISIVAKNYLEKYPGAKVVYEVRTSRATKELIEQWGGVPVRVKAGRVNIGPAMIKQHAPFGGETTGHLFFKENYFADSALIAMLIVLSVLSKSDKKLSNLIDQYRSYSMAPEQAFEVANKDVTIKKVAQAFKDGEQDWLDGLTVNYPDCWFNLRSSNTEPLIRLNVEAKTKPQLDNLIQKITEVIKA